MFATLLCLYTHVGKMVHFAHCHYLHRKFGNLEKISLWEILNHQNKYFYTHCKIDLWPQYQNALDCHGLLQYAIVCLGLLRKSTKVYFGCSWPGYLWFGYCWVCCWWWLGCCLLGCCWRCCCCLGCCFLGPLLLAWLLLALLLSAWLPAFSCNTLH